MVKSKTPHPEFRGSYISRIPVHLNAGATQWMLVAQAQRRRWLSSIMLPTLATPPARSGLELNPRPIADSFTWSGSELNARGFDEVNAHETFRAIARITNHPAGAVVTFQDLEILPATLQNAARNFNNPRE